MWIRSNPAKAVPALLNRLIETIETHQDVPSKEDIVTKIRDLMNKFPAVKQWNEKLLDKFLELDRRCRQEKHSNLKAILQHLNQIHDLIFQHPAKPESNGTDAGPGMHTSQNENCFRALSPLQQRIIKDADSPILRCLLVSYDFLNRPDLIDLKMCLLLLSIFPENAVVKKRLLIYWWIGEGLVKDEKEGEAKFQDLLDLELIVPHRTDKIPRVNKCQIHPWIRCMLIAIVIKEQLLHLGDDQMPRFDPTTSGRICLIDGRKFETTENENLGTIFNGSESYLNLEPKWLAKLKRLVVLQLGRWQASPTHHIEVKSELWLKVLGTQKQLKYLSLRGISRITQLPRSISELPYLEILDLHACHNLEKLPDDISPLKRLTHLDVSECYLLESMPKGLDKLTSLQVLKGFLLGNSQKTTCRIEDLRRLEKLRRLSIHIGSEAVIQEKEFDKLEDLKEVRFLKISWGVVREDPVLLSFPPSLEKLDLEGIPCESMPALKPSKLRQLKKLYIRGGQLRSLDREEGERWNVEILLLKYTKNLEMGVSTIKQMFPSLKYVKKVGGKKNGEAHFEWPEEESTEY